MLRFSVLGAILLLLTACTQVNANKSLTAEDVFEKAKEASDKLEDVQAHFVIEHLSAPIDPEQKKTTKYDIQSVYTSQPTVLHQKARISQTKTEPWEAEFYRVDERLFGKGDNEQDWDELPSSSLSDLFGPIYQYVNPTMDLTLFDEFQDEFELEPVDYGYALSLTMTKDQFKQFSQQLLGPENSNVDDKAFLLVERLEFEIIIDRNTFFVTDFKMLTDVTNYVGRDSHRTRQKVNATYSYFNDVEAIQVPDKVRNPAK
ncbi:DUF6612 family protein [Sporosarcina sp. 179-K 3D1 HS]|uniref:DUF6612 family protein n=1 Tax=Sporosarcina sp. 179-K 3D1 HS TaxID=3232169 RepID=UPI0039A02865